MGKQRAVVALGMFDGVHMGHRQLLKETLRMAARLGAEPVAHTYSNSPQTVFGKNPKILTLPGEKIRIMESLGVTVDMEPFTIETANTAPEDFMKGLSQKYELCGIVAGFNHFFGKNRSGDTAFLKKCGAEQGFEVKIVEPVIFEGDTVSSTRIRNAISEGDITKANAMLVDPLFYEGEIVKRMGIGHKLGYPTANLAPNGKILPPFGVYAGVAVVEDSRYMAVANIGVRPTVDQSEHPVVTIEPHLIDCGDVDLYGKQMRLELISFIRKEKKFATREELSAQIGMDKESTRQIFRGRKTI